MHPNPAFRQTPEAAARAAAAARGFGVLTLAGPEGVLASHVPFLLDGDVVELHLVRSNPLARHTALEGGADAVLIVSGADGYVSPDWYGEPDLVPTWNYLAVHLRGRLEIVSDDCLLPHLERVSARFEASLAPKPPWRHEKMSPGAMARMMRAIVPARMSISGVESTFKLNQNRSEACREGAAEQLARGATPGLETAALAALMRDPPTG